MKIKKFIFHIAVTLVILFGGLLLIEYLQTGQIDGLKLIGLAGGLLLLGVIIILRGMAQTRRSQGDPAGGAVDQAKAPGNPSLPRSGSIESGRPAKSSGPARNSGAAKSSRSGKSGGPAKSKGSAKNQAKGQ